MTREAKIRRQIVFRGCVQGVGFRYTAMRIARDFEVNGWVRNEPDGTVRCVVEGTTHEIDRFLASLHEAMAGYIADTAADESTATGEFHGFEIRRF